MGFSRQEYWSRLPFPSPDLPNPGIEPRSPALEADALTSEPLPKLMSTELVIPSNRLILCHPLLFPPSIFPSIRVFSNESALHIRWPKYWSFSFSINPSNDYSGLIYFRIDWFDLLTVQGTLKGLPTVPQFKSINSSALSLLYGPTLTSIHDHWKNHSFLYTDLYQQNLRAIKNL